MNGNITTLYGNIQIGSILRYESYFIDSARSTHTHLWNGASYCVQENEKMRALQQQLVKGSMLERFE